MSAVIGWIQQGFSFAGAFILLLGLLIFVHEMGHFLVAKYFKVKVEVFSLGFGKRIWGFKRGDTDYRLSLIPLGGYVKMFGDDPSVEIPENERQGSFLHKPVGPRIGVVVAGPLMNFFFAILIFFVIALIGEQMAKPVLGDIVDGSKAAAIGLSSGDEILSVNDQAVTTWDDVKKILSANDAGPIQLKVKRFESGSEEVLKGRTELVQNDDILASAEVVGGIDGLTLSSIASAVAVSDEKGLAAAAGVKSGMVITAVDGQPVSRWYELEYRLAEQAKKVALQKDQSVTLEFADISEKTGEPQNKKEIKFLKGDLKLLGLESTELYFDSVSDDSPAQKAGLKPWDRVLSLNGKKVESWAQFVATVKSFKEGAEPLKLQVKRADQIVNIAATPNLITQKTATGHKEKSYALGIKTALVMAPPVTFKFQVHQPLAALSLAFKNTVLWSEKTVMSFWKLIQNKVSPSSIGGPIMILQAAGKTLEVGISPYLKFMAIISINLFVLNLLPIPVLDGGHLLFYTIEAIRGAPMSMRKMEMFQQVGLFLLMGLMVLALFNDITRVLHF